ncbi:Lysosomal cystine transporter [Cinnamomum micranthum f. kanehirae]|uniref:Lysosomal cystine transporter n=1 Tax=Cinnamomum micranthum f. kanehirae TaxID=337451 RepID=A0A3S3P5W3_9MAGN|nr:Lysosomal cystine transporter [Cinnamomum micranthum f. kanehirae]
MTPPLRRKTDFSLCKPENRSPMASWNSITLEITYQVLGWLAFFCLTFGFYPQLLLNYTRKSVVGLNFDFVLLNFTKHSSYFIYNAALFFSPLIQKQYHDKYGYGAISATVAIQILIYEVRESLTWSPFSPCAGSRGSQKISKTCIAITSAVWVVALVCTIIAWSDNSWLWLISVLRVEAIVII